MNDPNEGIETDAIDAVVPAACAIEMNDPNEGIETNNIFVCFIPPMKK